jgi:hypothetical protein
MKRLVYAIALLWPIAALAQISPDAPMARALRDGRASALLPDGKAMDAAVEFIRAHTGSKGDVTIEFFRMNHFDSQNTCGRVAFGLYQASTKTFWGQFGGQLNVCEDGSPPLRECKGMRGLVRPDAQCPDGTAPVDTAEIKAAISKALAGGSMSAAQFKALWASQAAGGPGAAGRK